MFCKWHSIINHYRKDHIRRWVEKYPELDSELFVVDEKLDGANFQWEVDSVGLVRAGRRKGYLGIGEHFMGVAISELYHYDDVMLNCFRDSASSRSCTFRIFGELIGPGIGRVKYGKSKRLVYFGITQDDLLLPKSDTLYDNLSRQVCRIGWVKGLAEALELDTNFNSYEIGIENNLVEGVVMQPFNNVYTSNNSVFMIKKKNKIYSEKKVVVPCSGVVDGLRAEFFSLLTDNRVRSVFSKDGVITDASSLGKYIALVLDDAKIEFLRSNDVSELTKKEIKYIFKGGGIVFGLLKAYL